VVFRGAIDRASRQFDPLIGGGHCLGDLSDEWAAVRKNRSFREGAMGGHNQPLPTFKVDAMNGREARESSSPGGVGTEGAGQMGNPR
jgi:hypothetical protein